MSELDLSSLQQRIALEQLREKIKKDLALDLNCTTEELDSVETPDYTSHLEWFLRHEVKQDLKSWHINKSLGYRLNVPTDRILTEGETICAEKRGEDLLLTHLKGGKIIRRIIYSEN